MTTSTYFLLTRGLALAALAGGLGLGALVVGSAGCGVSVSGLCQQVCDCTGCSTTERQACEAEFNDAQKLSSDKGCTDTYGTYQSCFADHFQCVGSKIDATACATESAALSKCTGGTDVDPGGGDVTPDGGTPNGGPTICDIDDGSTHICIRYQDVSSGNVQSACSGAGGTVVTACPTAGALGECKVTSGSITEVETFYSTGGITADTAASACTGSNGTWTPT